MFKKQAQLPGETMDGQTEREDEKQIGKMGRKGGRGGVGGVLTVMSGESLTR